MSARIAVIGYASLDWAMATGPFYGTSHTTLVRSRLSDPWPGHGGAAFFARALAASGAHAEVITWVGPDRDGNAYVDGLHAAGVGVHGILVSGSQSPATYLFYPEDGGTVCIFDGGDCHQDGLSSAQQAVLSDVDWVIVAVAPRSSVEAALDSLADSTQVAWVVKPDPDAVPPALVKRLLDRAAVVTFGADERSFLSDAVGELGGRTRPGQLLVETRGSAGLWYSVDGRSGVVPAEVVSDVDTTGAGDTLVAALVAALAVDAPPEAALESAAAVTAEFLMARSRPG